MIPRASLLLLPVAGVIFLALHAVQGSDLRRVCYYTNWSQYRPDKGKYTPENVNPNLCTHYVYAFATLLGNRIKAFEWNDLSTSWSKGMFERFMALKKTNPSMKTLLAVGGWNLKSMPFHEMSHTPSGRKEFADSVVKFLRDNKFEGVDVDWEYPANRGGPPEDKHHFTELLQALYDAFVAEAQQSGRPRLMLTAAVAAGKPNIDTAYEIPEISQIVDFISVMTYDLHGSWEDHTGVNSPLYPRIDETNDDRYLNLHWAAEYWVKMGAPREKLNIGVALYGRTFTLSTADNTLGAPASGPGAKGPYTGEAGFLSYQEICEMEKNGGKVVDIPEQRVHYITKGDQWVGYDDKLSLRQKVCYIKSSGFGGVMVWAVDLDDFSGADCGQGPYPLLHAIVDELATPDRTNCVGPGPHQDIHHESATTQLPAITTRKPNTPPQVVVTNPPHITNGPVYTTPRIQHGTNFCYGRISDFYLSPYNCGEYFICANNMTFTANCAPGLHFNPKAKYCDRADNVPCHSGINTPGPTHFVSKRPQVTMAPPPTSTTSTTTTSTPRLTVQPITPKPYTPIRTTQRPYTQRPSTQEPYTQRPSTQEPYTQRPSTQEPYTQRPSTQEPYTQRPSTQEPYTQRPYTQVPYTPKQTTGNPAAKTIGDFCESRGNGLYRDPHSCSKYYECFMHLGFERICPEYEVFNVRVQACDYAYRVPGC